MGPKTDVPATKQERWSEVAGRESKRPGAPVLWIFVQPKIADGPGLKQTGAIEPNSRVRRPGLVFYISCCRFRRCS